MKDIIDLNGASGARYRFRLWRSGAGHLPMAGNYAMVQASGVSFTLLAADAADDLSRVDVRVLGVDHPGPVHLFTRLNVSRAVREAEARDIAAAYGLDLEVTPRVNPGRAAPR